MGLIEQNTWAIRVCSQCGAMTPADVDECAVPPCGSREFQAMVVVAASRLEGAVDLLRDVATAGVEFDDSRLRYVTVQIDRETWDTLATYRGQ